MSIVIEDINGNVVEEDLELFRNKSELVEKEATITVPLSFLLLTDHLIKYVKSNEYALLYNVKRTPNTLNYVISTEDVLIPKQRVSSATVDFQDTEEVRRYNGVVHRHPTGCRKFSTTDETKLNSLFTASWIYIPPLEMPDACININVDDAAKIQVPAKCVVEDDCSDYITNYWDGKGFSPDPESIVTMLKEFYPGPMAQLVNWTSVITESHTYGGIGMGYRGNHSKYPHTRNTGANTGVGLHGNHSKFPHTCGIGNTGANTGVGFHGNNLNRHTIQNNARPIQPYVSPAERARRNQAAQAFVEAGLVDDFDIDYMTDQDLEEQFMESFVGASCIDIDDIVGK